MKPKTVFQGKCVCEKYTGFYFVMFPDGTVRTMADRARALGACREWFKKHTGSEEIGVGQIEWR